MVEEIVEETFYKVMGNKEKINQKKIRKAVIETIQKMMK